eukprot:CFRG0267T1
MSVNVVRVKLYELSEDFEWIDNGCGSLLLVKPDNKKENVNGVIDENKEETDIDTPTVDKDDLDNNNSMVLNTRSVNDERNAVVALQVWSETEDFTKLLDTVVYKDTHFKIQQDTLLLFNCTTDGVDKALSFQEADSCEDTLARVHMLQGYTPGRTLSSWADVSDCETHSAITLPECTEEMLPELFSKLVEMSNVNIEDCVNTLVKGNYVYKLLALFGILEAEGNMNYLQIMFKIFGVFFSLNSHALFEHLLSAENLMDVIGVLEYDPQLHERIPHRQVLLKARLCVPIQFRTPGLVDRIEMTFRMQYMSDNILFRFLNDSVSAGVGSFVYFNKSEIVKDIVDDEIEWLQEVFRCLATHPNVRSESPCTSVYMNVNNVSSVNTPTSHITPSQASTATCTFTPSHSNTNGVCQHISIPSTSISELALDAPIGSIDNTASTTQLVPTKNDQGEDNGYESMSVAKRRHLTFTIRDLLLMSSHLMLESRMACRNAIMDNGLMGALPLCMCSTDASTRLAAVDIVNSLLNLEPGAFRHVVRNQYQVFRRSVSEDERDTLGRNMVIRSLVYRLVHDSDGAVKSLSSEVLKNFLDVAAMDGCSITERTSFLGIFYDDCFDLFASPITLHSDNDDTSSNRETVRQTLIPVIELMATFVTRHGHRMRNRLLRDGLIVKIMNFLRAQNNLLQLSAVRFLRAIIGLKDEFYNRHLVENKIFLLASEALCRNGARYNMLHSAILDILTFVLQHSTISLIDCLVENHFNMIYDVDFVDIFGKFVSDYARRLPDKYALLLEQYQEYRIAVEQHVLDATTNSNTSSISTYTNSSTTTTRETIKQNLLISLSTDSTTPPETPNSYARDTVSPTSLETDTRANGLPRTHTPTSTSTLIFPVVSTSPPPNGSNDNVNSKKSSECTNTYKPLSREGVNDFHISIPSLATNTLTDMTMSDVDATPEVTTTLEQAQKQIEHQIGLLEVKTGHWFRKDVHMSQQDDCEIGSEGAAMRKDVEQSIDVSTGWGDEDIEFSGVASSEITATSPTPMTNDIAGSGGNLAADEPVFTKLLNMSSSHCATGKVEKETPAMVTPLLSPWSLTTQPRKRRKDV